MVIDWDVLDNCFMTTFFGTKAVHTKETNPQRDLLERCRLRRLVNQVQSCHDKEYDFLGGEAVAASC